MFIHTIPSTRNLARINDAMITYIGKLCKPYGLTRWYTCHYIFIEHLFLSLDFIIFKINSKKEILGTLKWSPPLLNSFILCLNLKLFHDYFYDHNFNSTSSVKTNPVHSKSDRKSINKFFMA